MAIAVYGVTLSSTQPWSAEHRAAVHAACREVLVALQPDKPPSEEEIARYWQGRLEAPYSAEVYGQVCAYSAYWQGCDANESDLLCQFINKHCCPLGMTVYYHFSI